MPRKPRYAILRDLPNVGPATEADLRRLGITTPTQLRGRDPLRMYRDLCRKTGVRHDPCCIDAFMAIVDAASGKPARPWWKYTPRRKALLAGARPGTRRARRSVSYAPRR